MTAAFALTRVASMPEKPERAGVGRPSPLAPMLAEIRNAGPGEPFQITAEPLVDEPGAKTSKAAQTASRIRNGQISGTMPGEFDASDKDGHVFVQYVGQPGIDAANAAKVKRAENKERKAAKLAAQAAAATPAVPAQASNGEQLVNSEW